MAVRPIALAACRTHERPFLAEADIPYDKLKEMDEINPSFGQTGRGDLRLSNDVVNPLANTDPQNPIAGMPILNAGRGPNRNRGKRSLSPGFAGDSNRYCRRQRMLLIYGKKAIVDVVAATKKAAP